LVGSVSELEEHMRLQCRVKVRIGKDWVISLAARTRSFIVSIPEDQWEIAQGRLSLDEDCGWGYDIYISQVCLWLLGSWATGRL
jgi:hypothetical protein